MMNKVFTDTGWEDYLYWQTEDRKTLKKINQLIDDIARNGNTGLGKPEALSGNLSGFWSRRINDTAQIWNKFYVAPFSLSKKRNRTRLENTSPSTDAF